MGGYSVFRLFAGLARAARIDWKLMVKKVSKIIETPAAAKMPVPDAPRTLLLDERPVSIQTVSGLAGACV
jgi:hypothetical protein